VEVIGLTVSGCSEFEWFKKGLIFIHSFIISHKSIIGYRHHWMWNLSIVYTV